MILKNYRGITMLLITYYIGIIKYSMEYKVEIKQLTFTTLQIRKEEPARAFQCEVLK